MEWPVLSTPNIRISGRTLQWESGGVYTTKYVLYHTHNGTTEQIEFNKNTTSYILPSNTDTTILGSNIYQVKAVGSYNALFTYKKEGTNYIRTGNEDGRYDYVIQNGAVNDYILAEKIMSDANFKYSKYIKNNVEYYVEVGTDANKKLYTTELPVLQISDTAVMVIGKNNLEEKYSSELTIVQLEAPTISINSDNEVVWTIASDCDYKIFIDNKEIQNPTITIEGTTAKYSLDDIDDIEITSGANCYNIKVVTTRTSENNVYYLDSAYSNTVKKLQAPKLSVENNQLKWRDPCAVNGATYIIYNGDSYIDTVIYSPSSDNKYYNITSWSAGTYEHMRIKVQCSGYNESNFSEDFIMVVLGTPSISFSGSTISWNSISGATRYNVYMNGTSIGSTNLTGYNTSTDSEASTGEYTTYNITAGADNKIDSASSTSITKLKRPTITLDYVTPPKHGHVMRIDGLSKTISNVSCDIYVNGSKEATILYSQYASTGYDLDNLGISETGSYDISVSFTCSGYMDSEKSLSVTYYVIPGIGSFNSTDWDVIKTVSNEASAYWDVGDVKWITLDGTVCGTTYNNLTVGVYILDFDTDEIGVQHYNHDGHGLTLGGFVYNDNGTNRNMVLIDSHYCTGDGTAGFAYVDGWDQSHPITSDDCMWFNQYCHIRNVVLGSGSTSSPVSNSLMDVLPDDMRAVLSIMTTVGEDNDGNTHTSYDYIKLMSARELTGSGIQGINCDNFTSDEQYLLFQSVIQPSALNAKRRYYCYSYNSGEPDNLDIIDYEYYSNLPDSDVQNSIRWWIRESAYYAYAYRNPGSQGTNPGPEEVYNFGTMWQDPDQGGSPDFNTYCVGLAPVFYIEPDAAT